MQWKKTPPELAARFDKAAPKEGKLRLELLERGREDQEARKHLMVRQQKGDAKGLVTLELLGGLLER